MQTINTNNAQPGRMQRDCDFTTITPFEIVLLSDMTDTRDLELLLVLQLTGRDPPPKPLRPRKLSAKRIDGILKPHGIEKHSNHLQSISSLGKDMSPFIDIPLPSLSSKRTQREANFLSGMNIHLQSLCLASETRQLIAVEVRSEQWSWQALFAFLMKKKERGIREKGISK